MFNDKDREIDSLKWQIRDKEREIESLRWQISKIKMSVFNAKKDCKTRMRIYYKDVDTYKEFQVQRVVVHLKEGRLYFETPGQAHGGGTSIPLSKLDDIVFAGPNSIAIPDHLFY